MKSGDDAGDDPDPGAKQDPAGHHGNDAHVDQRSFHRHPGPGAEQGKHGENGGYRQQLARRVGRFMQQLAKQADADEEEQANQH